MISPRCYNHPFDITTDPRFEIRDPGSGITSNCISDHVSRIPHPVSRISYSVSPTSTADLGGKLGTEAFGKQVASLIGQELAKPIIPKRFKSTAYLPRYGTTR
jgi:hypothetical protein